jgi:NADP-dependent 3-hydroxy acid dehydrogenase YdfG
VITGAGSGFGRELARIGSKLGMNLVLADVQRDALDSTAAEMRAAGTRAIAQVVDVAKSEQVQRLADVAFGSWRPRRMWRRMSLPARLPRPRLPN